jgi:signal transduction histidine kinase
VAIAGILESTLKLIGNELSLARVEPRLETDGSLPPVLGNPRNLQQVFLNLCLNGIQAMSKGGVLGIRARAEGESLVRVDVSDTGVGISAENLGKIFEPFFTTKEAGKGTGLGLTVVQSIVEKHGGRISVESELGKGTTFTVLLPVARTQEAEA